ncbi:MAG: PhoH family protein [Ignavibacteriales bacterium]|nr:PhoH family protein [Ignavibacteriales bacterium]
MAEFEKRITLENIDMMALLGVNDGNIKVLENRFNTSMVFRGEQVIVRGAEEEVTIVEKVLKEMAYVLNTTKKLSAADVQMILELTLEGKEIINDKEYESVILYTKNDSIKAKTAGQFAYLQAARKNDICFAIGPAGTGKTYLAVALAVAALKKGLVRKIVLVRPAVEAGESLGFLPGDFREKIDPYLRPLYDALDEMLPSDKLKTNLEKGIIEIVPLAYMRGRTLNQAFVILDEAQNTTDMQMKMFLTRLGVNSKAIITGDITQIDLPAKQVSGLVKAQDILQKIEGIGFIYFEKTDVVRHKLVKDIIDAYEKFYDKG